jgi:hypothetical protein
MTLLRVIMLFKRLKLPGGSYINGIFYACCGLACSTINLIKLFKKEIQSQKVKETNEVDSDEDVRNVDIDLDNIDYQPLNSDKNLDID